MLLRKPTPAQIGSDVHYMSHARLLREPYAPRSRVEAQKVRSIELVEADWSGGILAERVGFEPTIGF